MVFSCTVHESVLTALWVAFSKGKDKNNFTSNVLRKIRNFLHSGLVNAKHTYIQIVKRKPLGGNRLQPSAFRCIPREHLFMPSEGFVYFLNKSFFSK